MLHLPADRLAELVDTEPTPAELAHLESCASCARERRAFAALRQSAAAEKERAMDPLLSWDQVRRGLVETGLIASPAHQRGVVSVRPDRGFRRGFDASGLVLRIAAGFALLAVGVAGGRFSERAGLATGTRGIVASATGGITTATDVTPTSASFNTTEEAIEALTRAQREYQRATAFLMASDTTIGPETPDLYQERLAVLDQVMGVARSALSRAPHDPVINNYYLATLGAREATLQQLDLSLPAGTRIDRF